jgi:hypothetical protein
MREGTTAYLIWGCQETRAFWEELRSRWGWQTANSEAEIRGVITDIFGGQLTRRWVLWGTHEKAEPWGTSSKRSARCG